MDYNIFNKVFKKLREYLIPLPIFNTQINYVEGIPYAIAIKDKNDNNITDKYYTIPYPYTEEIKDPEVMLDKTFLMVTDSSDKNYDTIRARLNQAISKRAYNIAEHAISDQALDYIDSDPDIGCIVSMTCGNICTYRYTEVKDACIYTIPFSLFHLSKQYTELQKELSSSDEDNLDKLKRLYGEISYLMYDIIHNDRNKSIYHLKTTNDNPDELSDYLFYTSDITNELETLLLSNEMVLRKMKDNQKVILVY